MEILASLDAAVPGYRIDGRDGSQISLSIKQLQTTPSYEVAVNGKVLTTCGDLKLALHFIERRLPEVIALLSNGLAVVHAGVVASNGRAVLLPGRSWSGKSTLVMALVEAGATYYSDECAVLDGRGYVYPYLRKPTLRSDAGRLAQKALLLNLPSALAAPDPIPVGLVLRTRYVENAHWQPLAMTAGETLLALFGNALAVRCKPDLYLKVLTRVSSIARGYRSERDEARAAAGDIIKLMKFESY